VLATSARHVVSGPEQVVAQIWSAAPVWAARFAVDGEPWTRMELSNDGQCRGQSPVGGLSKGSHQLEVVAVTTDGTEGSQRIEFMFDPTGRYTAVPQVSPVISTTQFC
jgi:hypothetical protein